MKNYVSVRVIYHSDYETKRLEEVIHNYINNGFRIAYERLDSRVEKSYTVMEKDIG